MDREATSAETLKGRLLDSALEHVRFEGWSRSAFLAAAADAGIDAEEAWRICTRGPLDLAIAHHQRGDRIMVENIAAGNLSAMRVRDRVAFAVRTRIEADTDREIVRRSSVLFALPPNAVEGGRLLWGTADAIWTALGDTSDDVNWYTKRAILAGVHSATLLYWLGDESSDGRNTWAFLDRRVGDVMEFEKLKGRFREHSMTKGVAAFAEEILSRVKAPSRDRRGDLPGYWPSGR